ncbi:MAG: zf-HC2 domain-containing protein [Candidatus Riflebacteria bacterium]|nr:zf-HC2 domain-containing protein [Candidatus Riflebacteria bacterium]
MERTLRCDEARLLMIDGLAEVPPRPPAVLAAHLAACPDCLAEWESLAGTVFTLGRSGHSAEHPAGPATDRREDVNLASGARVGSSPAVRRAGLPGTVEKTDLQAGPSVEGRSRPDETVGFRTDKVAGFQTDEAAGVSPQEGGALPGSPAASTSDRVLLARLWTAVERRVRQTPQEVPPRRASPAAAGEPAEPVPLSLGWRLVNYSYLLVLAICLYAGLASWQPHFLEVAGLVGLPVDSWLVAEYGIFLLFYAVGGFTALLAAPLLIKGKDDPHPFVAWVGRQFGLLAGRMGVLACW